MADFLRAGDEPWRRVGWTLPAALVITALALAAFLFLLAGTPAPPKADKPVEMRIVELPPEAPPAPPQPPTVAPPPAPPPPEPQAEPESPPAPAVPPAIKRPPPRVAAPRPHPPQAPPPAAPMSRPAPPTPAPPAAPNETPPGGGTMGARVIYQPKPEIPEELRHRKLALTALARFHIGADGEATAELVEATPDPRLNQAILDALRKWRFFPAMAQGKPVASDIDIKIPLSVE